MPNQHELSVLIIVRLSNISMNTVDGCNHKILLTFCMDQYTTAEAAMCGRLQERNENFSNEHDHNLDRNIVG